MATGPRARWASQSRVRTPPAPLQRHGITWSTGARMHGDDSVGRVPKDPACYGWIVIDTWRAFSASLKADTSVPN